MKVKAFDIQWETDGEVVDLPKEMEVIVDDDIKGQDDIIEFVSDEITNITGYCHNGFNVLM